MQKNVIKLNETQLKKIVAESVKKVLNETKGKYRPGVWLYDKKNGILYGDMDYEFCDARALASDDLNSLIDGIKEGLEDYANDYYGERDERAVKIVYVSFNDYAEDDAPFSTFYISNVDKEFLPPVKKALERKYHKPVKIEMI